jgi:sterol desaturase/sphingolipid hydroxylase (fatty acid hydroxylase superfamily)
MDLLVGLTNLPQFLITWAVYFGAGLLFLAIAFWVNRRNFSIRSFWASRFPFNLASSRSARLDAKVYAIGKLTDAVWGAPGTLVSAVVPIAVLGLLREFVPVSSRPVGPLLVTVIGIVLLLTAELADFIVHFCEHKVPALWELHKVHHSADSLNPLTSQRGHPFSIAAAGVVRGLFFGVPAGVAMHFAGLSLVEALAARALVMKTCTILTLDPLRHSPFPVGFGWLDRVFISPHMHQIHHSSLEPHLDKNFGTNLSLFDWLFGTGYKPARNEPIRLGLYGYSPAELDRYQTLYGIYVVPLAKAWGKIMPARRSASGPSASAGEEGAILA